MIKKWLAVLVALLLLFVSTPIDVRAANACNVSVTEIPKQVGNQITEIPLTFSGIDTSTGTTYELVLTYYEPVAGRTGHVWGQWPLVNAGEQKTISLGSITSSQYNLTRFVHPQAFFMDGNLMKSGRTLSVIKKVPGQNAITCDLQTYEARSSDVAYGVAVKTCGDYSSVGNRGSDGGCVANQICKTGNGNGWWCECDAECQALNNADPVSQPDPPPAGGGPTASFLKCGDKTTNAADSCACLGAGSQLKQISSVPTPVYCCGWAHIAACYGSQENYNQALKIAAGDTDVPVPPQGPVTTAPVDADEENTTNTTGFDIFAGPSSADFKTLNPLQGNAQLSSPGGIISRILLFAFPLAGLILFTMLVWGGFEMLVGATGKGIDAGKQRVTNAVIGFFLLFISYWIFQIVEVIFGLQIL